MAGPVLPFVRRDLTGTNPRYRPAGHGWCVSDPANQRDSTEHKKRAADRHPNPYFARQSAPATRHRHLVETPDPENPRPPPGSLVLGLVREVAEGPGWSVPADVPGLVARAYGDDELVPTLWVEQAQQAQVDWDAEQDLRRERAAAFVLAGEENLGTPTLAGLHDRGAHEVPDDEAVGQVVRDGDPSVEVILVRRDERGYVTLQGRRLGVQGEGVSDSSVFDDVVGATVRLPARAVLTAAALQELRPLPGWDRDPWLRRFPALVLDEYWSVHLAGRALTYDQELGLLDVRGPK